MRIFSQLFFASNLPSYKRFLSLFVMKRDRRIAVDRRTEVRYAVQIEIVWENPTGGKQNGMISDISEVGCFVLCSGAVTDGENVKLYLPAKRKQTIAISGQVTNHNYEIGFAARFVEIGYSERIFLDRLLAYLKETAQPI